MKKLEQNREEPGTQLNYCSKELMVSKVRGKLCLNTFHVTKTVSSANSMLTVTLLKNVKILKTVKEHVRDALLRSTSKVQKIALK